MTFMASVFAQSTAEQEQSKPTIALLGTFHFAGTTDALALKVDDLSSPKRQNEIKELVEALAKYKPTKILLEYPYENSGIDSLYQLYLGQQHTLTINERQQIGFRLAEKMGHAHVYPIDFKLDLGFDSLMTFLQENEQMNLFQDIMADMKTQVIDVWQKEYSSSTIKAFFTFINSDTYDAMNRNIYLERINKMGTATNHVGSAVVARWWERNFVIMRNIDATIQPGDRVFVLLGQGHTSVLKDFYKNRNDVTYVDILQYLKE